MMSKHTEGPWRLSNYHYPHGEIVADRGSSDNDSRPGSRLICRTADNGKSPQELKANARLIAAAPEMLNACEDVQTELRHFRKLAVLHNQQDAIIAIDKRIRQIQAAIDKAAS